MKVGTGSTKRNVIAKAQSAESLSVQAIQDFKVGIYRFMRRKRSGYIVLRIRGDRREWEVDK
jgi:hypothetical protein